VPIRVEVVFPCGDGNKPVELIARELQGREATLQAFLAECSGNMAFRDHQIGERRFFSDLPNFGVATALVEGAVCAWAARGAAGAPKGAACAWAAGGAAGAPRGGVRAWAAGGVACAVLGARPMGAARASTGAARGGGSTNGDQLRQGTQPRVGGMDAIRSRPS